MNSDSLRRRLITIPTTVVLWLLVSALSIPLLLVAAVVDAIRGLVTGKPWMAVRLLAMGWVYLSSQVGVIVIAGIQWLASVVFLSGAKNKRQDWAYTLQTWWVRSIMAAMRGGRRLMRRLDVEPHDPGFEDMSPLSLGSHSMTLRLWYAADPIYEVP